MGDGDIAGCDTGEVGLARRYAELVLLVRHQLTLAESGCYADGVEPDNVTFARTWVRAKIRHAVRDGVLDKEPTHVHLDGPQTQRGGW